MFSLKFFRGKLARGCQKMYQFAHAQRLTAVFSYAEVRNVLYGRPLCEVSTGAKSNVILRLHSYHIEKNLHRKHGSKKNRIRGAMHNLKAPENYTPTTSPSKVMVRPLSDPSSEMLSFLSPSFSGQWTGERSDRSRAGSW